MAPKRKAAKKASAAAEDAAEQPPLPDEQPPLPVEQPPLPDEQPPLPSDQPPPTSEPTTEPITELGDASDSGSEGSNDEDDPQASTSKDKGKGKAAAPQHAWQAVWAPEKNAYYFWNTESGEVTWVNPLAPPSDAPPLPDEPAPPLPNEPLPPAAAPRQRLGPDGLPEIDPALAHLLPPDQRDGNATTAALLARSGRFAADSHYAFAALDEYNRAKRFSEAYFDVDGWEKQRAADAYKRKAEEEAGVVRDQKVTKKDMERFKAKKIERTKRRNAWLYD